MTGARAEGDMGNTTARRGLTALALAAALTAGACSDGGDDTDGGEAATATTTTETTGGGTDEAASGSLSDSDPCSLLTAAEVSAATGLTFGEGELNTEMSNDNLRICDWVIEDPIANAQVLLAPSASFVDQPDSTAVDVPGADDAKLLDDGRIAAMLVGDRFVQVSYLPPSLDEDTTAITLELAAKAVARL